MKTGLISILTLVLLLNFNLSAKENTGAQFACGEANNKTIICSQDQVLDALHSLQTRQKAQTKSEISALKVAGRTLVTVGTVTFVLGGLANGAGYKKVLPKLSSEVLRMFGIMTPRMAGIIGLTSAALGGVLLALEPSELSTEDTMTGFIVSDNGTNVLLALTDKQLIDYAKEDANVSMRVMKIFAALSSVEQKI
jgi:hypothetical protein